MIDLHSHILPGLDDGPADLAGSVQLARAAVARGTTTMVATPHIRDDHQFPVSAIEAGVEEVNAALSAEGIDLTVVAGGELSIPKALDLDTTALRNLCLGNSRYLLVESPYSHSSGLIENVLSDLQSDGLRPILAHPERSVAFVADYVRLERIVASGVLSSVTAGSMLGAFGSRAHAFTTRLFADGAVHNVASDAHSAGRRPPGLGEAFEALDVQLPGLLDQQDWFAREVPEAILGDRDLPPRPPRLAPRRRGLRRLLATQMGFSRPADGDAVR